MATEPNLENGIEAGVPLTRVGLMELAIRLARKLPAFRLPTSIPASLTATLRALVVS